MDGRDHNNKGFSVWLADAGAKGGTIVGATDEYDYRAVENPKSVYELRATILRLLGLDQREVDVPGQWQGHANDAHLAPRPREKRCSISHS